MERVRVVLFVATSMILFSCNRHLSDVFYNDAKGSAEIFGDELIETAPPIFYNNKTAAKPLDKYPFDKGGYAIVGLLSESDGNDLQKEMGQFYTDDISVLNEFKKAWVFSKQSPISPSDYHYVIYITHKGTIVEQFAVNLNSHVIATDKGYFYFDSDNLTAFKSRVKKPVAHNMSFKSISEGRNYLSFMSSNKNLVLAYEPIWKDFEGQFTFTYKDSEKKEDPSVVEKKVERKIKKSFPNEKFQLNIVSFATSGEYEIELICNRRLFEEFDLYPSDNTWAPYEANIASYWKK